MENTFLEFIGSINYSLMTWTHTYYWPSVAGLVFLAFLIGMTPLKYHHEHSFFEVVLTQIRKAIIWISVFLIVLPFIMLYLYDTTSNNNLLDSQNYFIEWFWALTKNNWFTLFSSIGSGLMIRLILKRYFLPTLSNLGKKMRNQQTKEKKTDIRDEQSKFNAKDFKPEKYYKKNQVLVGLTDEEKPIYIPYSTWKETNMQLIGPTRYGKGVILGCLMDQAIKSNDALFYIDPKEDKFAPHVMYQAAKKAGRKFYYLALHDRDIGKYSPFTGGTKRDALSRFETAFGLELTGDPGTDFYKTQEMNALLPAFDQTRSINGLISILKDNEDANRVNAELRKWSQIESLSSKKGGFSIEKALLENAVVYVQGSLDDAIVKTATKSFIAELIQEAKRLNKERQSHLTIAVDEVSFLVSKILAQSLATSVGFNINFVLAYQSQNDLLNIDDKSVNARYIHQSINVNSQIKAVYGGADFETAEWAANLSGTITKETTKMERTNISDVGGETWDDSRFVGIDEENYINTNMVLSLPPRVCVFIQPRHLASICHSSFISVKDESLLTNYLEHKRKTYTQVSHAKPDQNHQSPNSEPELITSKKALDAFSKKTEQPNSKTPTKQDIEKNQQQKKTTEEQEANTKKRNNNGKTSTNKNKLKQSEKKERQTDKITQKTTNNSFIAPQIVEPKKAHISKEQVSHAKQKKTKKTSNPQALNKSNSEVQHTASERAMAAFDMKSEQ